MNHTSEEIVYAVGDRVRVRLFSKNTLCEVVGLHTKGRRTWYTLRPIDPIPCGVNGQPMPDFSPKYEAFEMRPA